MINIGIHNIAEVASALVCLWCTLYKPSVMNRWFVGFLWLTVMVEFSAKLMLKMLDIKMMMYNLFTGLEFVFYALVIKQIAITRDLQKVIRICMFIFVPFLLINLFAWQGTFKYNTYTAVFSAILLCLICLLFFYDSLKAEVIMQDKLAKLLIVSGVFIFYAGTISTYASLDKIMTKAPGYLSKLYNLVVNNLNLVLYGLFSLAFILEVRGAQKIRISQSEKI